MSSRARTLFITLGLFTMIVAPLHAAQTVDPPFEIFIVTFRGCEEACDGFLDYLDASDMDVSVTLRDIDRDRELLPDLVGEVNEARPDLLVTWGTTVTLGMIGTIADGGSGFVEGVPTVFMIVADPVGAGIVTSLEASGRPLVTGTRNRVPESTQMEILAEYRPFTKIGLVYNDTEVNAVLKAEEIHALGADLGFEVVERIVAVDAVGNPDVGDIEAAVADIAALGPTFLYLGSSSFLLENADAFTSAAIAHGLPVATAYDAMVRDSKALISVASAYYNVGQLAGFQAERILSDGEHPGDMEVLGLDRFTVLVNMETARELELYPPMLFLRFAEIVNGSHQ